jgi:hypothetical protein
VVTQSAVHRGIVKVLGWLQKNPHVSAFHPSRLFEAMDFARVVPERRSSVIRYIHEQIEPLAAPQLRSILRLEGAS